MPNLPASFRAFVVDRPEGGAFTRGLRELTPTDLPPGEVTIRVEWSGVNFKDGLAAREDGRVARAYPLVPGTGNASGAELATTVFPFILGGVALLGTDSANMAIGPRRTLWNGLATDLQPRGIGDRIIEVDLDTLEPGLDAIVAGQARGRWVVRVTPADSASPVGTR